RDVPLATMMLAPRIPAFAHTHRPKTAAVDGSRARIRDRDPASFDTEGLQQLVDVGKGHQDLTRLRTLIAADHPVLRELVDDPASARVSDVELALHERDGSSTLGGDRARRTRKKRVELALLPLLPLPLGGCALFQDLFHVSRRALRLPVVDHAFDLRVADESALDAARRARGH